MKYLTFAAALAAAGMLVSSQVLAGGFNVGDTYNTYNTPQANAGAFAGAAAGANAKAYGGNAKAYGGNANSQSGVYGSGNSANFNSLSNRNDIDNKNVNVNKTNVNTSDFNSNFGVNKQGQGQGQVQGNVGLGSGNKTEVNVGGDTYEAAAYAPGLAGLTGTACMGSTSISGGAVGFSAGIGTTWTDKNCQKIESMKAIGNLPAGSKIGGHSQAAVLSKMAEGLEGVDEALSELDEATMAAMQPQQVAETPRPKKTVPSWCGSRDRTEMNSSDARTCGLI